LISDWNNGNAHFLRGVITELILMGHNVTCYEPEDAWSMKMLKSFYGESPVDNFHDYFPELVSCQYTLGKTNLYEILEEADVVIVHEWNSPELIKQIGSHRKEYGSYKLFFHDTHHRSITDQKSIAAFDLKYYDGVLAFGSIVRDIYIEKGWTNNVWIWHEAADVRIFKPCENVEKEGDVVWVGNWGDEERSEELQEFLINPVVLEKVKTKIYGVRYPEHILKALLISGIDYGGWLPNYKVPEVMSKFKVTIHVPRRPYVYDLPGIPTIRIFEALACGIPLVCSPWFDTEQLFISGKDYLIVQNGNEMRKCIRDIINDDAFARSLSVHGFKTIREKHTCKHRARELLVICGQVENHQHQACCI
jgi:spore maturation protein CgeB